MLSGAVVSAVCGSMKVSPGLPCKRPKHHARMRLLVVRWNLDQLNKESNSISKEVGQIKKVRCRQRHEQANSPALVAWPQRHAECAIACRLAAMPMS